MELSQIKELLQNPQVRAILEEELKEVVAEERKKLDDERVSLEESKKVADKQLFLTKKTIMSKVTLYENKLKAYYSEKFDQAVAQLAKDTFKFINEGASSVLNSLNDEVKNNTKAAKMQEAFAAAVRAMAPHMNINELASSNEATVEDLKNRLNESIATNKKLEKKLLEADVTALVVNECVGYPSTTQAAILNIVKKASPASLTEAKTAIVTAKEDIRKQEETLFEEAKKATKPAAAPRQKLKDIVEGAKQVSKDKASLAESAPASPLSYSLYLGE